MREKADHWIDQQLQGNYLGDILMQDTALSPSILRQGVIAQILPVDFTMRLNPRELLLLLHIMILLQNIHNGGWIFQQLLELINEMVECEASSILQADEAGRQLTVAMPPVMPAGKGTDPLPLTGDWPAGFFSMASQGRSAGKSWRKTI